MLPTNVGTGLVVGQFGLGIADGSDPDHEPELIPVSGRIIFTPSVTYLPNVTADPNPITIISGPIVAVLDADGYVCTPGPDGVSPMYRGIRLFATNDPDMSVENWTWSVVYQFDAINGFAPKLPAHAMALLEGEEIDLTKVVPVPSSPGIGTEQALALLAAAEAAAQSVRADADAGLFNGEAATLQIGSVSSGPIAEVINIGDEQNAIFDITLEKGDKGDPGTGIPDTGEALQVMRMDSSGTSTEWVTPTKTVVGLSNVDNSSDMNKPVSTMQKLALDEKLDVANLPDEVDSANKNLIEDPASLTATALSAAIDGSVSPVADSVTALAIEVGEVSLNRAPVLDMPIKARTFHSALYQTGRGRAIRIAVIGSSTNEGAGVNHLNDRWVDHLGMRLQRGLLTGNPASEYQTRFFPALWQTQTFTNPALTGSTRAYPSDPTFADWYGPAGRDVRLELGSTPGTITFTVYGRRVRLWHSKSGSLGIPHYSIDGGADVALPTQNNATITAGHRTAWIDLGSLGNHTFTVKANLQNSVMVSGLEVSTVATDAEEANQVHIYEMSRSGTDFLTTAGVNSWMNPSWKERQYEWLKTANPDLIIMGAGSNAYAFGLATPAQIETNVRTFISEAQTVMGTYPSWLLVGQQERQPPASPLAPWADYLSALERIAADTSGVSFIDWTDHIPAYNDDATFYADIAHVNRLGHVLAGYHTAAKLTGG